MSLGCNTYSGNVLVVVLLVITPINFSTMNYPNRTDRDRLVEVLSLFPGLCGGTHV